MRTTFLLALVLGFQYAFTGPSQRLVEPIQVINARATYHFARDIHFEATLLSGDPIRQAYLLFQPEGGKTTIFPLVISPDGSTRFQLDISQLPVRPFSRVYYWFRITTPADQEYTSPSFWFDYLDNRFEWQTLSDQLFRVHWYQGGIEVGQAAENTALTGLAAVQKVLPLPNPSGLDIYIYASPSDLQSALEQGGQNWVGGHASPDQGVILISADPGDQKSSFLERQIPHELSHIMLYQITGSSYENIPVWLREGLASIVELYPNPDYPRALQAAKSDQTLVPITTLCGSFPLETAQAITAYAESASFTRYLSDRFGYPGIQSLIQEYKRGVSCEEAVRITLGVPLSKLESEWREEVLGMPISASSWQQVIPFFVLMGIVVLNPLAAGIYWFRKKRQQGRKGKEYA